MPVHICNINVSQYAKIVIKNCEVFKKEMLAKAAQKVKETYPNQTGYIVKMHSSYDGSWQKRRHISKSELGCVIESKKGLCVDFHK